ncbi:MAG: glycosyltransferase family 39 protein [Flavobacteriaceae bacterium]|nr:glycosyltransferase family 39 protein [Flavobacteriaceae bacterium]
MKQFIQNKPLLAIVLAFQIFRFSLLPLMGLMPQDAYYFFYGQHLALSYFDHPGMIGYALRLFSEIFGQSAFVVKLTDFTLTSLTLVALYNLSKLFLSKQKQQYALVLISTSVMVSIVSIVSTPDVPLLLFWTLSLIALYKAVFYNNFKQWLLAGVFMGLAFDSKYTAVFLQFGIISFLILSKGHRKLILSKGFITSMLLSVLVAFPVLYWNYQHDFVSFLFQSTQRAESVTSFGLKPLSFLGTIGHELLILIPVLFIFIVILTFKTLKKHLLKWQLPKAPNLFLLSFFLPTFLGFFAISLFYWVKINWLMPGYISGLIFASIYISKKWIKLNTVLAILIHIALAVEVVFYVVPIKSDDTWFGWEELAQKVEHIQKEYPNTFIFSADNYKTTSVLNFYLNQKIYAQNVIGKFALHYNFIDKDLSILNGKNALFINSDKRAKTNAKSGKIPKELKAYFSTVTELEPIIIKHRGKTVRKFWVYHAINYQNIPNN